MKNSAPGILLLHQESVGVYRRGIRFVLLPGGSLPTNFSVREVLE